LVENKNGAVICKHIGYGYIDARHAYAFNRIYREHLNPYLNYHRPYAQATVEIDGKGRKRVLYTTYQTPLETLLALDKPAQYLRGTQHQCSGKGRRSPQRHRRGAPNATGQSNTLRAVASDDVRHDEGG
jgi:hypothetical protein